MSPKIINTKIILNDLLGNILASPRVFISSTCFDLAEVRDSLIDFCQGFGFEVIMSENGDVFYHPDLHTHESCVNEISNCQIFILVIGGRFGGEYKIDPSKSITNAEYIAAKELGIPVFTFIKKELLSDHYVFQKNKEKEFSSEIEYPSVENQKYAENIFTFINTVRSSNVNNGFFDFQFARDIHEKLRKQLAGMFFEFLTQRNISNQLTKTNESINNLSIASKKIEDLVKNIYRQVDEIGANDSILEIDKEGEASKFFSEIANNFKDKGFIPYNKIDELSKNPPESWEEFLIFTGDFKIINGTSKNGEMVNLLAHEPSKRIIIALDGNLSEQEKRTKSKLSRAYKDFLSLSVQSRKDIMGKYDDLPF